jgi:hypothetical protein
VQVNNTFEFPGPIANRQGRNFLSSIRASAVGRDSEGCGEHLLTLPDIAGEHRFADHTRIKPRLVASDLAVKWRSPYTKATLKPSLSVWKSHAALMSATNNCASVEVRIGRGAVAPADEAWRWLLT